jgi:hypothetical protein
MATYFSDAILDSVLKNSGTITQKKAANCPDVTN